MRWIIMITLIFIFIQPAPAALKKCVDDAGMFHYYNKILPPECQGKATVEMNQLGVVIKRHEIKKVQQSTIDPEKLKVDTERKRKKALYDNLLLNIYTSKEEIDLTRDRNVQPVKLAIVGIKKRLDIARSQLQNLQNQAEVAKQSDDLMLAAIKKDMIPVTKEVANLQSELNTNHKRIKSIQAKFDADKKRFQEIMKKNYP